MNLTFTPTTAADLEDLYRIQLDPEARHAAAFVPPVADREAFVAKATRHLADPTISMWTIRTDAIIGSVAKFVVEGDAEVTYWIDRAWWGRGIATRALGELVGRVSDRPLFGRAAWDNLGSQKVLERCGFVRVGTDRGFAPYRDAEIEEIIYRLD